MLEGVYLPFVLIGRLGRRGTGLVGVLNEVPVAVELGFCPPAVRCKSQAPPGLLEEDGLARPVADVEEQGMLVGELRGDQAGDCVECAGQLPVRAGDEANDLPRVLGAGLELDLPGRARQ